MDNISEATREPFMLFEFLTIDEDKAQAVARKQFATRAKKRVASYMKQVGSMELEVREFEWNGRNRKAVFSTRTGKQFGTIDTVNDADYEVGQRFTISGSIASDGNIRAVVEQ